MFVKKLFVIIWFQIFFVSFYVYVFHMFEWYILMSKCMIHIWFFRKKLDFSSTFYWNHYIFLPGILCKYLRDFLHTYIYMYLCIHNCIYIYISFILNFNFVLVIHLAYRELLLFFHIYVGYFLMFRMIFIWLPVLFGKNFIIFIIFDVYNYVFFFISFVPKL